MAGPFELQLRQFAERAGDRADQAVRQVSIEVWGRLIYRSPVDTGRFRGNWMLQVDAIPSGVVSVAGVSGAPSPPPPTPTLGPGQGVGHVIWIANNLPYARRLEEGYSGQAPFGMVGLTTLEFANIVDGVAGGLDSISVGGVG